MHLEQKKQTNKQTANKIPSHKYFIFVLAHDYFRNWLKNNKIYGIGFSFSLFVCVCVFVSCNIVEKSCVFYGFCFGVGRFN